MTNKSIIIRHDDYDFRLSTEDYIKIHEEFKKRGLVETANMQFTQWGHLSNVPDDLVRYINENKDSYSIQIHGWGHFHYDEMEYDFIVRDLAACQFYINKYFGVQATTWYTPWNVMSNSLERAANFVGLKVSNESNDIWRFIREAEVDKFSGETLYFHGWKADEMQLFPQMLDLVKKINEKTTTV